MAKKYTVKPTDNLLDLSKKFGTSPSNILKVNGIKSLTPGQTILQPSAIGSGFQNQTPAYGGSYNPTVLRPVNAPPARLLPFLQNQQPPTPPRDTIRFSPTSDLAMARSGDLRTRRARENDIFPTPGAGVGFNNPYQNLGLYNNSPYNGFQTPTTNGFMASPVSSVSGFQTPTTNGFLASPNYPAVSYMNPALVGSQYTGTAGYWAGYNQQQKQAQASTPSVSRAAGKAQFLSGNGINPNSGYIPTRSDVWNMKADARRRNMEKEGGDEPTARRRPKPKPLQNQGSAVNTAVSWRVG